MGIGNEGMYFLEQWLGTIWCFFFQQKFLSTFFFAIPGSSWIALSRERIHVVLVLLYLSSQVNTNRRHRSNFAWCDDAKESEWDAHIPLIWLGWRWERTWADPEVSKLFSVPDYQLQSNNRIISVCVLGHNISTVTKPASQLEVYYEHFHSFLSQWPFCMVWCISCGKLEDTLCPKVVELQNCFVTLLNVFPLMGLSGSPVIILHGDKRSHWN